MATAYRIPDTPRANAAPAEAARGTLKTVTIGHVRMPERSFIIVPDGNGKVPLALQPHVLKARVRGGTGLSDLGRGRLLARRGCPNQPFLLVRVDAIWPMAGRSPLPRRSRDWPAWVIADPGPDNDSNPEVPHG